MYSEADLLPLSGLQHLLYCERRAYLVHAEMAWRESVATAEGRVVHERAHAGGTDTRGDVRTTRSVRLRSLTLGLSGVADVVEFHRLPNNESGGCVLTGVIGRWQPFPVEYKRGVLRYELGYAVQLCAQALCLEEMLRVDVSNGALFFGASHKRMDVTFDAALRATTATAAARLREILSWPSSPPPVNDARCRECSMNSVCLPHLIAGRRSARSYLHRILASEI